MKITTSISGADLHTEVSRLWKELFSAWLFSPKVTNYSNICGLNENVYEVVGMCILHAQVCYFKCRWKATALIIEAHVLQCACFFPGNVYTKAR